MWPYFITHVNIFEFYNLTKNILFTTIWPINLIWAIYTQNIAINSKFLTIIYDYQIPCILEMLDTIYPKNKPQCLIIHWWVTEVLNFLTICLNICFDILIMCSTHYGVYQSILWVICINLLSTIHPKQGLYRTVYFIEYFCQFFLYVLNIQTDTMWSTH